MVNFVYTSCAELCPIEMARLAEVKDKLGDAVGRDIFLISKSVDPEPDTPDLLKAFADAFEVNDTSSAWSRTLCRPSGSPVA